MRILGIKTTHDGGAALVDGNQLVFSHEMEKYDNNPRYEKMVDLGRVVSMLRDHGYSGLSDVDRIVFDGWYKTHKIRRWHGLEVPLTLAPYRRGFLEDGLFTNFPGRVVDLEYSSYPHVGGHLAAAYCTRPFDDTSDHLFVLVWDAHMFPFLYRMDAHGHPCSLGALFYLTGDVYTWAANVYSPFDGELQYPAVLGVAGKVMAYVATGTVQPRAIEVFESIYRQVVEHHLGHEPPDELLRWDKGEAICLDFCGRLRHSSIGLSDADMLTTLHAWIGEKLCLSLARALDSFSGSRDLCIGGGVALNIKWNSQVRDSGVFDRVWVPPFPNDSGSALGAACCEMVLTTGETRLRWNVYSGQRLNPVEPLAGWRRRVCSLAELAAILHDRQEPVVFLTGRAELGPRALGNRSVLAPPTAAMKARLNTAKRREWYRPIAPVCLEHRARDVFDPGTPDPYMLFDHAVRHLWQERVPAVRHLDGTARLQTVSKDQNPALFELLSAWEALTGIPLLCNTSANFEHCGFFCDVQSAMRWGEVPLIWSEGSLYMPAEAP